MASDALHTLKVLKMAVIRVNLEVDACEIYGEMVNPVHYHKALSLHCGVVAFSAAQFPGVISDLTISIRHQFLA